MLNILNINDFEAQVKAGGYELKTRTRPWNDPRGKYQLSAMKNEHVISAFADELSDYLANAPLPRRNWYRIN